jgi:hypothetical protein
MKLAGHVACIGKMRVLTGLWWGNPKERDHLKDLDKEDNYILYTDNRRPHTGVGKHEMQ